MNRAAIEMRRVTRRFGKTVAVDRFTLDVYRREIFALVGPDGAGKTTLIRLICGALEIDAGSLRVDGTDVMLHPADVQSAIGYMPQRFSLYPDLSVIENLRFYGDIFGVAREQFAERSSQLLDEFALSPFRDRIAEALSGGMKQKLALACTLIHSPSTILLDEPTAGVDPVSRREFWKILHGINRANTTVFVSTPYMDEAERATRVGFIMRGALVQCGTPQELKATLGAEVVQVECLDRAGARRVLRGDPAVRSVEVFGETLHALVDSAEAAIPKLRASLAGARIDGAVLQRVAPTLEDAFVARLTA